MMYSVYIFLTTAFLVYKINFSNGWSVASLYADSSAKFKRETSNKQNITTTEEGDVPDSFICKNGEVISALFRCDGAVDCNDKSDETHKLCSHIVCSPYLFKCTYGACISQDNMCDGKEDCVDGSDEEYEMCSSNGNQNLSVIVRQKRQECNFKCGSGDCISTEQLCDGIADCQDGSDETRTQCGNVRCPSFLFQCKYGACISKNQVCNAVRDCADGSDEDGPGCTAVASDTCRNFEFRCKDGTCIDNLDVCDGVKNCPDGSDETENSCIGLICPTYLYRCAYGACVHKTARCNGRMDCADGSDEVGCGPTKPITTSTVTPPVTPATGCLLPQHPQNGYYKLTSGGTYKVNAIVGSSSVIAITCDQGYVLSANNSLFFCNQNYWVPGFVHCIRTCPSIPQSDTYDAVCRLKGVEVSCEDPVQNTTVRISCKPYYKYPNAWTIPECKDGNWDTSIQPCYPDCGRKIINAETLVIGGTNAEKGEYPWMVAIYNTTSPDKEHICGGSIISRVFVLSAAHCFADTKGVVHDKNGFLLAAGKYYRSLDVSEPDAQIRKIERLYVHEDYRGRLTKFRDDIALIEVKKFDVTLQVQPVCVDWENIYEEKDFKEDNKAVVAGWGFITEGSSPSEVLKKLIVPFKSTDTCRQYMDPDFFQQYYSTDKICAGYKDQGSSVCSGDSGGGLFFRSKETTFFVRAVVSLAPRSQAGCDSNHFALFTKVSKYASWLEGITRRRL
ncbi:hypothetical protein Trydic_g6689 [Trypoxylus dichotomus]